MGRVKEAMLEGFLCEECGVVIDEHSPGYIRSCSDCKHSEPKVEFFMPCSECGDGMIPKRVWYCPSCKCSSTA